MGGVRGSGQGLVGTKGGGVSGNSEEQGLVKSIKLDSSRESSRRV